MQRGIIPASGAFLSVFASAALASPVSLASGSVTTLAGSSAGFIDGSGLFPKFNDPYGLAVAKDGTVYVADRLNCRIRKITPDGTVSTLAGGKRKWDGSASFGYADGAGSKARFDGPEAIVLDSQGTLYVADTGNHRIRRITAAGLVDTFAGGDAGYRDGDRQTARFNSPGAIACDAQDNLYLVDTANHRIRKITKDGRVSTYAGAAFKVGTSFADGPAAQARFYYPHGIAVAPSGNVYVADGGNNCIRKISPNGVVTTFAGKAGPGKRTFGNADGSGAQARFALPYGLALDGEENLYVAEINNRIRRVSSQGVVSTLAGGNRKSGAVDGPLSLASFSNPHGLAFDPQGHLLVCDTQNQRIRRIQL